MVTKYHLPTILTACFAMVWFVLRAHFQSITHDEADSYIGYVLQDWPSHWYPSNGNHVLNSILMRLLTWMFGISHLAARGPALLGAAIYMSAVFRLCILISDEEILIWPLFVCFVYNPFIMDYMVAARGYSLALGFLMIAIWIVANQILHYRPGGEPALRRACALASASAALSFCSHFGFAYVNAACILLFFAWACVRTSSLRERARLAVACLLPGLLVVLPIAGGVLWKWIPGQIYLGARSYRETWHSIIVSTFYELNPYVVNPLLLAALDRIRPFLPALIVTLCVAQFALLAVRRWRADETRRSRLFPVAIFVSAMIGLTMFLHWRQLKLVGLPLPEERYGIFFVPLALLVFGIVTSISPPSAAGRILRKASIALLFIGALYFIGCLRMMYFRQYKFGADVKAAFPTIQEASRRQGVHEVPTSSDYSSALNFYRIYYHDSNLEQFRYSDPPPSGKRMYVLPYGYNQEFIKKEGLKVIFHGELTDLSVLVHEDSEPRAP